MYVCISESEPNGFMMIVSCDVNDSPLGGFLKKLALFIPFCILPRVLNNKRSTGVRLTVCFPTCTCSTGDARCPFHQSFKDKALGTAISFYLHDSLITLLRDRGVKSTVSFTHPDESENSGHELKPILIDVESVGRDSSESVEHSYSHERSTQGEAQYKTTSILCRHDLPGISSVPSVHLLKTASDAASSPSIPPRNINLKS